MREGVPKANVPAVEKTWAGKAEGLPPPPPPVIKARETNYLVERSIEDPELLGSKDASKEFLQGERNQLAQEIREVRKKRKEELSKLQSDAEQLSGEIRYGNMQLEKAVSVYDELSERRSQIANTLAGRIRTFITNNVGFVFKGDQSLSEALSKHESEIADHRAKIEEYEADLASLNELINSDEIRTKIKQKLESHYADADKMAQEKYDESLRSVEQVILRNNAFIVHQISEHDSTRHNENSNVSSDTSYTDDVDIVLSLEPSLATSSVQPGIKSSLWTGASGFLIGGGSIRYAKGNDAGTKAMGIKDRRPPGRRENESSIKEIDREVGRNDAYSKGLYEKQGTFGMNELVIDEPKIAGLYQNGEFDEEGRFWAGGLSMKEQYIEMTEEYGDYKKHLEKTFQGNFGRYLNRFQIAQSRNLPLYVMTPDRRVFECVSMNADMSVDVGKEIFPEDIANANAGLPIDERKKIGSELLKRTIFRDEETQAEARQIISGLSQD